MNLSHADATAINRGRQKLYYHNMNLKVKMSPCHSLGGQPSQNRLVETTKKLVDRVRPYVSNQTFG